MPVSALIMFYNQPEKYQTYISAMNKIIVEYF